MVTLGGKVRLLDRDDPSRTVGCLSTGLSQWFVVCVLYRRPRTTVQVGTGSGLDGDLKSLRFVRLCVEAKTSTSDSTLRCRRCDSRTDRASPGGIGGRVDFRCLKKPFRRPVNSTPTDLPVSED